MGYATTTSFNLIDMEKKENNLVAPQFEIYVAGTKLSPTEYHVTSCKIIIPVTVGADEPSVQSGECSFSLEGMFDLAKHTFSGALETKLSVGKTVEVKGGYKTMKRLFLGAIKAINITYKKDGVHVEVTAIDALESMRGGTQINTFNKENPSKTVREILQKVTSGSPKKATIGTIDTLPALNVQLVQEGIDNIGLMHLLSRRFGKILACIHGEIVFTDMLKNSKPIGTLSFGKNLMSFEKSLDSSGIYGSVTVNGLTPQGTAISGTAANVTITGTGRTAKQYDTDVASRIHEEEDAMSTTQQELSKLAQNLLNENNIRFVSCKGSTIGIPDMIPGRYITLDGMSTRSNGKYFITKVVHNFGSDGYTTSFECKGAKSQ